MSTLTKEAFVQIPEAMTTRVGRRATNMREKRARIRAAATALFGELGFDGVTTQQISDQADIAAGTLFRYASSKSELFLMVYNEELRMAIADGVQSAKGEPDVETAVAALVEPVLTRAQRTRDADIYQRELLFGPPDEQYRSEGLALVDDLEAAVADRMLVACGGDSAVREVRHAAARAARSVFAVLNLLLVQPRAEGHADDSLEELRAQTHQIVKGFLASIAPTFDPEDT